MMKMCIGLLHTASLFSGVTMEFEENVDFFTEMFSGKILEMYVILCAECGEALTFPKALLN